MTKIMYISQIMKFTSNVNIFTSFQILFKIVDTFQMLIINFVWARSLSTRGMNKTCRK